MRLIFFKCFANFVLYYRFVITYNLSRKPRKYLNFWKIEEIFFLVSFGQNLDHYTNSKTKIQGKWSMEFKVVIGVLLLHPFFPFEPEWKFMDIELGNLFACDIENLLWFWCIISVVVGRFSEFVSVIISNSNGSNV